MTATFVRTRPAPQRDRVLAFIKERVAHNGFPSMREIADHMGWKNKSGAIDACHYLVAEGHLTRQRRKGRPTREPMYEFQLVEGVQ
jgi:hypothetical protein